jgi:hypothetical protein
MSIFEDFNEDHFARLQGHTSSILRSFRPGLIRVADPAVGAAFASRSLDLEQLSASFMVDTTAAGYGTMEQQKGISLWIRIPFGI